MSWKLKVWEYGKIKQAEIEVAPLTFFVGDNNSGKSYLMSLLWGEQWNGGKFGLNFGKRISFAHNPVPMKRNAKGVLVGELVESDNGR